ncbi:hypothetical protein [Paludibacterium sp. B53371]|uniref:hypothetical protein n=1 Tax=Paludibacterium sp. B53371 TaxID=2806263 RepID=UPI001C041B0C|nr:hypothetical protein [Paludibacterium sp. B53371]
MKKLSCLFMTLALFSGVSLAQVQASADELNKRNLQINRHCTGIVQARLNYAKLPSAERASRDREFSEVIEDCYRRYMVEHGAAAR